MRILFVGLDVPYPPRRGQRMRNWSVLKALSREGHSILLVSLADAPEPGVDYRPLHELCQSVQLVRLPASRRRVGSNPLARLRTLTTPLPYAAWRVDSPHLREAVRRSLTEGGIDLVLWDETYNLINLPERLPVPVVLNSHDVVRVLWERHMGVERNPLKFAFSWLEHRKLCRWEPEAMSRLSGIVACSQHDARAYRRLYPRLPVGVANNSIDIDNYAPGGQDDGRTLLFVGGLDWFPNLDAVTFFARAIVPELRKYLRPFRFLVAGKLPSPSIRERFADVPEMEFTGEVSNMVEVIAAASICVVPLRIGSGTRLKILESAAMAKPVVSTAIGAEGLEFDDGEHIVLADDPAGFAGRVADLLGDPTRRRRLGEAARERVASRYSLPALGEALRRSLAEFAPGVRPSPRVLAR